MGVEINQVYAITWDMLPKDEEVIAIVQCIFMILHILLASITGWIVRLYYSFCASQARSAGFCT